MLNDLFGWYRRNLSKMSTDQIKKELNEVKQIEKLLQNKLKKVS